jgi:hypothetical protein
MPMFQLIVGGSNSSLCQRRSWAVSSWMFFISTKNGIIARFALIPKLVLEWAARPRAVALKPYVPLCA